MTSFADAARQLVVEADHLHGMSGRSVAESLGVSYDKLLRNLGDESIQSIVDEERKRRFAAAWPAPTNELAEACGYPQAQSFTRAFRRWFGVTLTEYRRAAQ